jgi:2-C-methyl-D-erythritol 4-phosphate cytidylyltransferase
MPPDPRPSPVHRVGAVIPAAGSGLRLGGGTPKALRLLHGRSLLERALTALAAHPAVAHIVIAVPADQVAAVQQGLPQCRAEIHVVAGGEHRQASVAAALAAVPGDCDIVLVHDAARPFVPLDLVARVVDAVADGSPAVIPALPVPDTIKRVDAADLVVETLPRDALRAVQTPQGFRREVLVAAHEAAASVTATDDAALVEALGYPVLVVPGDPAATKITVPADLDRAAALLAGQEGR